MVKSQILLDPSVIDMVYNNLPCIACHVNSDGYKACDKSNTKSSERNTLGNGLLPYSSTMTIGGFVCCDCDKFKRVVIYSE